VLRSGSRRRVVRNRNQLVARHRFVDGVKTGHTIRARYVLIGAGDKRDARVISVVLGEPSQGARDQDTLELLRWGLAQFRSVLAVRPGRAVAHASVADREGERVALVSREPVRVTVRRGERAESRVDAPGELEGPLPAGRRVGRVEVLHRGRVVGSAPLVTARAVPEVPALRRLEDALGAALTFALGFAILVAGLLALRRARPARARGEGAATGEP
jgi:serine-type D-Ala-D-Ala carboxypeptidase (penicillin-binding protein 5/6)